MPIMQTVIQGGGTTPTGTKNITSNGVYDVTDYASADVQVPTTAPAHYVEFSIDGNSSASSTNKVPNFSGIKTVGNGYFYQFASICSSSTYGNRLTLVPANVDLSDLEHAYQGAFSYGFARSILDSIDLSSLQEISGYSWEEAFYDCRAANNNYISINLSSLTRFGQTQGDIGGGKDMFASSEVGGVLDLSSLQSIIGREAGRGMFQNCTKITSVDLSSLTNIGGSGNVSQLRSAADMFSGCSGITTVDMSSLVEIGGQNSADSMFFNCSGLTSVNLSSLTTVNSYAGQSMFRNCTSLTSIDLSSLTNIGTGAFSQAFINCTSLNNVTLNANLTKRNPSTMFSGAPITAFLYENTEYITGSANYLCSGNMFTTANFASLEMINVSCTYMCYNNTALTSAKFPIFTRWNGGGNAAGMFSGCTNANFTDVYFPMLCVFKNAVPFTANSFPSQLTVHFRKDQQALIESTSGASSNFGAAALVFDQIGTITVNGTDYIRQGKCNETGYYAWQKATSNITVGGMVYTFDITQITRNATNTNVAGDMLYGWTNGSTTIYTNSLKPQVGDYIWTAFNVDQSTTPITAVDNEFVYTVDSAEPAVSDTVYSDTTGTVLGTISSIA